MNYSNLSAALEAVQFQTDPLLFESLVVRIKQVRREKDFTATSSGVKAMSDLIFKRTGLNVTFMYPARGGANASVMVPDLNANHALLNKHFRKYATSVDALKLLKASNQESIQGWVNYEKGSVGGVFSEFDCQLNTTIGLMESTLFSAEEVAAVILHELGHLFYFFAFMANAVTTNATIAAVAEHFTKIPREEKIELINATSKRFNLPVDELEWLAENQKKETVHCVLLTKTIEAQRSELGSNLYDQRSFEVLADQYAARMGAGKALTTGLAKMHKHHPSRLGLAGYLVLEVVKIVLALCSTILVNPVLMIGLLLAYDPTDKIYDEPEQRMKRLRLEVINGMKKQAMSPAYKKALAQDLEVIDETMKEFTDRRDFYEFLYTTFLPGMRDQRKRMKNQQTLETLANNELFATSLKLSLLKV